MSLAVWCNGAFGAEPDRRLSEGTAGRRLIRSAAADARVLEAGRPDPAFAEAEVAFGQPAVSDCLASARLRWVHLSSAGYARYDGGDVREHFRDRGIALTTSSSVFADPCAQHVLAMMLALNRRLPASLRDQMTDRSWHYEERRFESRLLTGQTVLLLGFGAIGRRLLQLLEPFGCAVYAVRRQVRSERGVRIVPEEDLTRVLALADHVVDLLPETAATRNWVNARRLACCRPGARFYNVGRGTTVDQGALAEALASGRLGAAYLDVTDPEPLPPGNPLWDAPNCHITPHTAGGRPDQNEAVVAHFLSNLAAFESGKPLADRVI